MTVLPKHVQEACLRLLKVPSLTVWPVSGGDINQAFRLDTDCGRFFLKYQTHARAFAMFQAEVQGLTALSEAKALPVPDVLHCEATPEGSFLLLSFLDTASPAQQSWELLGQGLAQLHRHSAPTFGFHADNFIGTLPQSNRNHASWADFYAAERLLPQAQLAFDTDLLDIKGLHQVECLCKQLEDRCPAEAPSLLHGDLWKGNVLFVVGGQPYLIDPAIAFAHREMDLAMARLFGGFSEVFFRAYEATLPIEPGFQERLPVYQLYYLLVHVNLFGRAYLSSVITALRSLGL